MFRTLLRALPPGPPGKTGFPWDAESGRLPGPARASGIWPRITVGTPSFNQGPYLEECIRSVLLQGYPKVEYIIIDGGSADGSVETVRKYAPWLTHWCSERDRSQAHALKKCLGRATGEFFNWINSDDVLAPGALWRVAEAAQAGCDLVAGACLDFDDAGSRSVIPNRGLNPSDIILGRNGSSFHQPSVWWRREWIERCGGIDERFDLAFDYDLLLRFLSLEPRIDYAPEILAHFRLHPSSKTCARAAGFGPEREMILENLAAREDLPRLRNPCLHRLRQLRWWREVDRSVNHVDQPRLSRAVRLALRAVADPEMRMNRFTLGAIRRILYGVSGCRTGLKPGYRGKECGFAARLMSCALVAVMNGNTGPGKG